MATTNKSIDKFKISDLAQLDPVDATRDVMIVERQSGESSIAYKVNPNVFARSVLSCLDFEVGRRTDDLHATNTLSAWYKNGSTKALIKQVDLRDGILKSATYSGHVLTLVFDTSDRQSSSITIDLNDLVDTYTAGNGLSLTNKQFSIKANASSGVKVDSNGVGINYGNGLTASGNQLQANIGNGLAFNSSKIDVVNASNLTTIAPETWTFTIQNGASVSEITKNVMVMP